MDLKEISMDDQNFEEIQSTEKFNKEKFKSLFYKIFMSVLTFCYIFIPIIIVCSKPPLTLIDYEAYIDDYYSYSNSTSVNVYLTFNREVNSGYAVISFYDGSRNLLKTENRYFYSNGYTEVDSSFYISGKVEYYELISYSFEPVTPYWIRIYYVWSPFVILFLVQGLLTSYKEYNYNDRVISVYAGWYHHTLRIDGELGDEHNTLSRYSAITLSTTLDGEIIEARITLSNRISVKVNNKLLKRQVS